MYRFTVSKGNFVKAVYYNASKQSGLFITKSQHPGCDIEVIKLG